MKLDCGPTPRQRHQRKQLWHRWFAWFPVRIGPGDCRWLETIHRKGTYHASYGGDFWTYEYAVDV